MTPSLPRPAAVRHRSFAAFDAHEPLLSDGHRRWCMRGQNFIVERIVSGGQPFTVESASEVLVILPDVPATLSHAPSGTVVARANGQGSVCILAAGVHAIALAEGGSCAVIASNRGDIGEGDILNADAYAEPDPRIVPTGRPYLRRPDAPEARVFEMASVPAPRDNPRLKMLQTETLSINWVDYHGERDRTALSPHSHTDFEQGSLALAGNYVHHLRVPWGKNANLWRPDEHLPAPSPSLAVIPVDLVHTTEGVGGGHHLLIDIFSPPRADFIAKGWVHNAGDYVPVRV